MKKILFASIFIIIALFLLTSQIKAQAPDGVNYQAVVRNNLGLPLNTQAVSVRFTIHQGSPTGTSVFQEIHATSTNQFGLINLELGSVDNLNFSVINWGTGGAYYLQIEVDAGAGFDDLGASQLLSVPYALFARSAATGAQGFNSLIDTVSATLLECPTGGYRVNAGLDLNASTVLDAGEVTSSFVVCNGSVAGGDNWGIDTVNVSGANITGSGTVANPLIVTEVDGSITNEIQTLSINVAQDSIFLSNGGAVQLPSLGVDNDWTVNGNNMVSTPTGNVGIGTPVPFFKLDVFSTDTVVAAFRGNNPNYSAVAISNVNPSADVGFIMLTGADTAIFGVNPAQKMVVLGNTIAGGHVAISADSSVVSYGKVIGNIGDKILNLVDTIYNIPNSGAEVYHLNQGTFVTDSLYKLGNNAGNFNWVLANDGFGQAVWTDPATLPGGGGGAWTSNGTETVLNTITDNVGIGLNVPINSIDVSGNASIGSNYAGITTAPIDGLIVEGDVGIGVSSSLAAKLDVNGNARFAFGKLFLGNVGGQNDGYTGIYEDAGDLKLAVFQPANATNFGGNSYDALTIKSNTGLIGIGTNTPNALLDVAGVTETDNLRVLAGAGNVGDVLTSDAAGNATWQGLPAPGSPISIIDADGDTEINVEAAPDQDVIHFSLGASTGYPGAEYFTMIGPRLEAINNGNSVFIGERAGAVDDLSFNFNVFVGYESGLSNTNGDFNTAIGYQALQTNTTGARNIAIGGQALNTSVASSNNISIGFNSFRDHTSGDNNVVVGHEAGLTNISGVGNVFLGNNAGRTEAGSNRLYIDNSSTTTPLIWGNFLTNALQINGTLNINGAYTLPTVDGALGDVLSTDGSGNVSWQTPGSGDADWTVGAGVIYNTTDDVAIGSNNALGDKLRISGNGVTFDNNTTGFNFTSNISVGNGYSQMLYDANTIGVGSPTMRYIFSPRNNANTGTVAMAEMTFGKIASQNYGYISFSTRNAATNYSERVRIDAEGRVGLGITAPTANLHLNGTLRLENMSGTAPAIGSVLTSMDAQGNAEWQAPASGDADWNVSAGAIFNTNDNVGIGTVAPLFKLDVDPITTYNGPIARIRNTNATSANEALQLVTNGTGSGLNLTHAGTGNGQSINIVNPANAQYAIQVTSNGTNNGIDINHTGTSGGTLNGIRSVVSGASAGTNNGGSFSASGAITANYAVYATASASGTSQAIGTYSTVSGTTTNTTYGVYGQNSSSTTGQAHAGYFQNFNNTGSGTYGVRSNVNSTNTNNQYGFYTGVNSASGGTKYGIYTSVTGGTTNWGGYFAAGNVYVNDNLGIGVLAPSSKLDINGNVEFTGDLRPNNLPGVAGEVLTSQGTGVSPTWQAPKASINFSANSSVTGIPAGTMTPLVFDNVEYDNGGNFNIGSGQFVATVAGVYHVDAVVTFDSSANYEIQLQILRNGGTHKTVIVYADPANSHTTAHISADVYLPAINSVSIGIYQNSGGTITPTGIGGVSRVYFTGHLVR